MRSQRATETDSLLSSSASSERRKEWSCNSWKGAIVALAVGQMVIILLLVQLLTRSAPVASPAVSPLSTMAAPPNLEAENAELALIAAGPVPHKLAIEYVTPREDQAMRGTCWDFATIAMLEQSYRAQGVANGWLQPDQFVALSEQAYGVAVLEQCRTKPSLCLVPGDNIWMNSTEGGEIPLLYYLPQLNNSILPKTICPYITDPGKDSVCPGMNDALKRNPLKFNIKSMNTLYEMQSIKNHLRAHRRAMGFSTVMTDISYFYPCTGRFASRPECTRTPCATPCPYERFPAGLCCIRKVSQPYNLEGEFYWHGKSDFKDGGHAMLLVGYNDNYVTESGDVGGFILKNNWAGGSHSVDYWMQEISRWDESRICPNSINPRNWYDCKSIENCLSPKTALYADVSYMPLRLKCVHPEICSLHDYMTYFVKNASHAGDDMVEMCMFAYNENTHKHREQCLGPYPLDSYAAIFRPVKMLHDDPDRCGFYFFPYKLLHTWWATYHDGFVTDFDTTWDAQSYMANKDKFPELDYSLISASTREQNRYVFSGPFPHDMTTNRQPANHAPAPTPSELAAAGLSATDLSSFTNGIHPRMTSALYRVVREINAGANL